jgi:hypothetical protein
MNIKKNAINEGLVFDGLYFTNFNACGRYKGTETARRPQWLKDNLNVFTPLADILKEQTKVRTDVVTASNLLPTNKVDDSTALPQRHLQGSQVIDRQVGAGPASTDQHFELAPRMQEITPRSNQVATSKSERSRFEATQSGVKSRTRGHSDARDREKEKPSAGRSKSAPKRSLERMLIVVESLQGCPVQGPAARKAGIHPKTLAYWLKCSEAGHDGYDLVWEDIPGRFHEHCAAAIEVAYDKARAIAWRMAMGETYRGTDAYLKRPNVKMLKFLLKLLLPEKYGKRRKDKATHRSAVLIVGQPAKREYNTAASVQTRRWKALSKRIGNAVA